MTVIVCDRHDASVEKLVSSLQHRPTASPNSTLPSQTTPVTRKDCHIRAITTSESLLLVGWRAGGLSPGWLADREEKGCDPRSCPPPGRKATPPAAKKSVATARHSGQPDKGHAPARMAWKRVATPPYSGMSRMSRVNPEFRRVTARGAWWWGSLAGVKRASAFANGVDAQALSLAGTQGAREQY